MRKRIPDEIQLTQQKIEEFLADLKARGRSAETLKKYRADLMAFYRQLPEDKLVNASTLPFWQQELLDRGFAVRTINTRISAVNSFLSFLNLSKWHVSPFTVAPHEPHMEISRDEYLKLLLAARERNQEQLYYLIKLFACIDISVQDLVFVTAESIRDGIIRISDKNKHQSVHLPVSLQEELLLYTNRKEVVSGPIFEDILAEPRIRAHIANSLKELCSYTDVPEERATVRALRSLRQATYTDIRSHISNLIDQAYDNLLADERTIAGWDQPTGQGASL